MAAAVFLRSQRQALSASAAPGPRAIPPVPDLAVPPRFLEDVYQAASECNKCSLCQAVCPTYVINPVEWETARGRVSLVRDAIEGRIDLRDIADGPPSTWPHLRQLCRRLRAPCACTRWIVKDFSPAWSCVRTGGPSLGAIIRLPLRPPHRGSLRFARAVPGRSGDRLSRVRADAPG